MHAVVNSAPGARGLGNGIASAGAARAPGAQDRVYRAVTARFPGARGPGCARSAAGPGPGRIAPSLPQRARKHFCSQGPGAVADVGIAGT